METQNPELTVAQIETARQLLRAVYVALTGSNLETTASDSPELSRALEELRRDVTRLANVLPGRNTTVDP